jgi:hypothetical protein
MLAAIGGGRRFYALRAVAMVAWAWLAHLVGLAVIAILTWSRAGFESPPLLPLLPQFVAIAAFVAVGSFAGRLAPSLLTPVVAVGAVLAAQVLAVTGRVEALTVVGGATHSLLGFRHVWPVLLAQVAWFAAITAGALLVVRVPFSRRVGSTLPLWATLAALIIGSQAVLGAGQTRFERVASTVEMSCVGSNPAVCAPSGYVGQAKVMRTFIEPLSRSLAKISDRPVPTRWEQTVGHYRRDGIGYLDLTSSGDLSASSAAWDVVVSTARCENEAWNDRQVVDNARALSDWLVRDAGLLRMPANRPGAKPLSEPEARQVLAGFDACR